MKRFCLVALRSLRTMLVCFLCIAAALFSPSVVSAQGVGYWHTRGSMILDANNQQVRIAGVNWYGFETDKAVLSGLYAQDYKAILATVRAQGV